MMRRLSAQRALELIVDRTEPLEDEEEDEFSEREGHTSVNSESDSEFEKRVRLTIRQPADQNISSQQTEEYGCRTMTTLNGCQCNGRRPQGPT